MPTIYTSCHIVNDDLSAVLRSSLPQPSVRANKIMGSANGANVVLCTEEGFTVCMHDFLVDKYTNLLDAFDSHTIEELRDPFGSLVIVLQGVEDETLLALSHLLYTGQCNIKSEEVIESVGQILATTVVAELDGSFEFCSRELQSTLKSHIQVEMQSDDSDSELFSFDYAININPSEADIELVNDRVKEAEHLENKSDEERMKISTEDASDQRKMQGVTKKEPNQANLKNKRCCEICNKVFKDQSNLSKHRKTHTGEKPFKCPQCDKRFTRRGSVRGHERAVHGDGGEKPFKCSLCDRRFPQKGHLRLHERRHTGEKPYHCPQCDRRFSDMSCLVRHELIHTGIKPFQCSECGIRFRRKDNLQKHKCTLSASPPCP